MAIVVFETFDDLIAHVKAVTAKAREKADAVFEGSELAKKFMSVWDKADFGCQRVHVGQLLHAILQELTGESVDFSSRNETAPYPRFAAVVPTGCDNGHDYPIGKVCVIKDCEDRLAVTESGETGNHLTVKEWRYASDEEIDAFFSAVTNKDKFFANF